MSMIPMDFGDVLGDFGQTVRVTDTQGDWIDGVWVEDAHRESREVFGIVLTLTIEQLQFLTEGSSSAGGISITTDAELFFTDPLINTMQNKQSYVEYAGYRYRVVGTGLMQANTLHNIYNAVRFIA